MDRTGFLGWLVLRVCVCACVCEHDVPSLLRLTRSPALLSPNPRAHSSPATCPGSYCGPSKGPIDASDLQSTRAGPGRGTDRQNGFQGFQAFRACKGLQALQGSGILRSTTAWCLSVRMSALSVSIVSVCLSVCMCVSVPLYSGCNCSPLARRCVDAMHGG